MKTLSEKSCLTGNQITKIEELLSILKEKNRYYSNLLNTYNIKLENISDEFTRIPILTKSIIKDNSEIYLTEMEEEILEEITTGSTGTPLKCYKTKAERYRASLILWQARRKVDASVKPDNFFPIVGQETYETIGDFCDFSLENMQVCFDYMMKIKPRWISGPPTAIYRYAKLIKEKLVDYKHHVKYIELSGEYVDPGQRAYIENVFQCKTLNQYGTRECWCIAYECTHGEHHVVKDVYVETINHNPDVIVKERAAGEVVITSMLNTKMPFIRYNIGDYGVITYEKCDCGETSQIIHLAGGRIGDLIKGSMSTLGDLFFKRTVTDLIELGYDDIDSFRVEQLSINKFAYYIVPSKKYFPKQAIDFLTQRIKRDLGQNVIIDFKFVSDIPPLSSGKTKTFVNLV